MNKKQISNKDRLIIRLKLIEVILEEFKFRRGKDLHYSIRKFASDIDMNYVHLSQVLQNQRGLSRKKAEHISMKFNLSMKGRRRFYLLVSAVGKSGFKSNLAVMGLRNLSRKD